MIEVVDGVDLSNLETTKPPQALQLKKLFPQLLTLKRLHIHGELTISRRHTVGNGVSHRQNGKNSSKWVRIVNIRMNTCPV